MKQKILFVKIGMILSLFFLFTAKKAYAEEDILDITRAAGYTTNEAYRPKASIIIDAASGHIVWENNPDLVWVPASTTKMMTVYLAFEAMEQGKFNLDSTITATENDAKISQIYALSNNKITAGVSYPIRDLLSMIVVPSSNVATVMLANLISNNDEAAFVQMMNDKCAELGMTNSVFYNCSGAQISSFNGYYAPIGIDPTAENKVSARDLSIMAYHLIKKYPSVLDFTKDSVVTVMKGTPYEETFENYNYSLNGAKYSFEGMDGLKTGSNPAAGFNFIATAKRNETRFIGIILGVGDWADQAGEYERHPFANALLEKAFNTYEYKKLLSKGKNTINGKEISIDTDFYGLVQKGTEPVFTLENNQLMLNNGLPQVSPTILPQTVNYTETLNQKVATEETVNNQNKEDSSAKEEMPIIEYLISIMVIILGGIFMVLTPITSRRPVGRRARQSTGIRPLFILGLVLLASGITLGVFSWQIGTWLPF